MVSDRLSTSSDHWELKIQPCFEAHNRPGACPTTTNLRCLNATSLANNNQAMNATFREEGIVADFSKLFWRAVMKQYMTRGRALSSRAKDTRRIRGWSCTIDSLPLVAISASLSRTASGTWNWAVSSLYCTSRPREHGFSERERETAGWGSVEDVEAHTKLQAFKPFKSVVGMNLNSLRE